MPGGGARTTSSYKHNQKTGIIGGGVAKYLQKNSIFVSMCRGSDIVGAFMRLLALQPLKVHYFWGKCFAWLLRVPVRYRRDVVMVNLARSFPDKKYAELGKIARKFYDHLGRIVVETIWFAWAGDRERLRKSGIWTADNVELLRTLYEKSSGIVILNSHFGNWELLGGIMNTTGDPEDFSFVPERCINVVYKALTSKFWDRVMLRNRTAAISPDSREDCGLESREVLRYALRHKDEKHIYIFPTDQCPYAYASVHTVDNFMHQPTKTMTGGAAIAAKLGMAVVYMGMREKPEGGYSVHFKEICDNASGYAPEEVMNRFYRLLEEDVNLQPWNYLWTHKRWKK